MNSIQNKSISELGKLIKLKKLSPSEVLLYHMRDLEQKNDKFKAFINVFEEDAIAQAEKLEEEISRDKYRGPLHGIPVAVKDNIYIKNKRITNGSMANKDFIPSFDSNVVNKLKKHGAIVLGTLNMHELALGVTTNNPHYGLCKNPWNINRI